MTRRELTLPVLCIRPATVEEFLKGGLSYAFSSRMLSHTPVCKPRQAFINNHPGAALAGCRYTVVVNAGKDCEIARESVVIDSDVNLSRLGLPTPPISRRYTVMISLQ